MMPHAVQIDEIRIQAGRREINPAKVAELAESIREVGLLNPVTIRKNKTLIAGLHRIEAFRLLGLEMIEANEVNLEGLQAEMAELDENIVRNNLHWTDEDDAWLRRKEIYELLHPEKMYGGDRKSENFKWRNSPDDKPFYEDAADQTGKSGRSVREGLQRAENLLPEVKQVMKDKDIGKSDATKIARLEPEQQKRLAAKIASGEAKSFIDARRLLIKEERKNAAPLIGKYRIIYADPPWSYGDKRSGITTTGAEDHYPCMTIDELCLLPINDLADDNAVLFLWVTAPLLDECFSVIRAWGFQYKAQFIWYKILHNMGHYNSVRHENLLVCTKGSCLPDNSRLFNSVVAKERTFHSQKPDEFRQIIDSLYPAGKRIELFARERTEGWDSWGNEPNILEAK